jgi:hypothetical protein
VWARRARTTAQNGGLRPGQDKSVKTDRKRLPFEIVDKDDNKPYIKVPTLHQRCKLPVSPSNMNFTGMAQNLQAGPEV